METLIIPRGEGKTSKLIKQSAKTGYHIVCHSKQEVIRVQTEATARKLRIPFPLTFEEFIKKRYSSRNIRGFLIDNADALLQKMSNVQIETITVNS